jgi:hypothetical protein
VISLNMAGNSANFLRCFSDGVVLFQSISCALSYPVSATTVSLSVPNTVFAHPAHRCYPVLVVTFIGDFKALLSPFTSVTSALAPNTTLADIIDPQPNDEAVVLKDETHSNEQYRWQMADYNGDGIYNWVAIAPDLGEHDFFINQISADELQTGAATAGKIDESAFGNVVGSIVAGDDERIVGAV